MEKLTVYKNIDGLTEAEMTVERERELSTRHVKIDLLNAQATFNIPEKILEEIEINNNKIDFIEECRSSKNPMKNCRFPVGQTPVLDVKKFLEEIEKVKYTFINEKLDKITTTCIEIRLQKIFDDFMNRHEMYITYI